MGNAFSCGSRKPAPSEDLDESKDDLYPFVDFGSPSMKMFQPINKEEWRKCVLYACPVCPRGCYSFFALINHFKIRHQGPHKCPTCGFIQLAENVIPMARPYGLNYGWMECSKCRDYLGYIQKLAEVNNVPDMANRETKYLIPCSPGEGDVQASNETPDEFDDDGPFNLTELVVKFRKRESGDFSLDTIDEPEKVGDQSFSIDDFLASSS